MSIVVNSDQVNKIADEMDLANKNLKNELNNTSNIMKNLGSSWDSSAYRESNTAFQKFEQEYSNSYEKIISNYVTFLREKVSSGYVEVEKKNSDLSSAFK